MPYLLPWCMVLPCIVLVGSCMVCKGKQNGQAVRGCRTHTRESCVVGGSLQHQPFALLQNKISNLVMKCDLLCILGIAQKHLYAYCKWVKFITGLAAITGVDPNSAIGKYGSVRYYSIS